MKAWAITNRGRCEVTNNERQLAVYVTRQDAVQDVISPDDVIVRVEIREVPKDGAK
jgi:hypothetical protein